MLQLFPAPSVLGLIGQLPPMAKSFALEPLMVMRLIAIATVPGILERESLRRACFVSDLIAERQRAWRQGALSKSGQTTQKRQRKNSYFGLRRNYFFLLAVSAKTI